MGFYRLKAMNDPQDGTGRIKVREASADGPEVHLVLDPDGTLPPVDLTPEETRRVGQFAVLEEISDKEAEAAKEQAEVQASVAGGQPPTYSRDELKSKSVKELQNIAQGRPGIEEVPTTKDELVTAILADQEVVNV